MPQRSTSPAFWAFVLFAMVCGVGASVFFQPLIHANENAANVIVTVFSILAGFLIAIMSLLGDQSVLPGSWKMAATQRQVIRNKLIRQKWLFYVYLTTLLLIFAASLLSDEYPCATIWLEHIYLGLAVFAFLLSFRLPSTLMEVQPDRVDAVVGARRKAASVIDRN
ncbi:hypothetical protein VSX64_14635 [Aurantimonas sp. C2-6-R+9]|nr:MULTISPECIES: hypothetical protein [unclassified Aurantimonas]MEC5291993.1 hypothetical protein [Aurantimonas sp. C2-3-R2]MEC5382105.1 hypothetical protein [Aurantimonas sp. C2-6-R+9]MEC5413078.1 hypothetical protein [Aurantimonas sp. C2-4-R8]